MGLTANPWRVGMKKMGGPGNKQWLASCAGSSLTRLPSHWRGNVHRAWEALWAKNTLWLRYDCRNQVNPEEYKEVPCRESSSLSLETARRATQNFCLSEITWLVVFPLLEREMLYNGILSFWWDNTMREIIVKRKQASVCGKWAGLQQSKTGAGW